MDLPGLDIEGTQPCRDPECDGTAEPEQDGDHRYLACTSCGFEFGYERVEPPVPVDQDGGVCAIGVPESVRRQFSPPSKPTSISLGTTIPVRSAP